MNSNSRSTPIILALLLMESRPVPESPAGPPSDRLTAGRPGRPAGRRVTGCHVISPAVPAIGPRVDAHGTLGRRTQMSILALLFRYKEGKNAHLTATVQKKLPTPLLPSDVYRPIFRVETLGSSVLHNVVQQISRKSCRLSR